jgi:hypothetical protein
MALNAICKHDQELRRVKLLLICYYLVQWHQPNRVLCQFGMFQTIVVEHVSMNASLHK